MTTLTKTRMTAKSRRSQLLDVAAAVIGRSGRSSALTMERLALEAGVSKPLVYRHFPTREILLLAVLENEWSHIDRRTEQLGDGRGSLSSRVRAVIASTLDYVAERGAVLLILMDEALAMPEGAARVGQRRQSQIHAWARFAARILGVPVDLAVTGTELLAPLLTSAARLFMNGVDRALIEELYVAAVMGATRDMTEVARRYTSSGGCP